MNTQKERLRNQIFLYIIIAGAAIGYLFYSQPSSTIHFSEDTATVSFTGPKNTFASFLLTDITVLSYIEEPDYGTAISGGTLYGGNLYGDWRSDSLGTFQAFATTKIPSCILISDGRQTIVFNHSNTYTTHSLFQQLEEYILSLDGNALTP